MGVQDFGEGTGLAFLASSARLIVKRFLSPADVAYKQSVEWVESVIKEALVSSDGRKYQFEYDNEVPQKHYRHKKTGNLYRVIGFMKNCTNAQDGQEMVVYTQDGNDSNKLPTFCRERTEFVEKFEPVELSGVDSVRAE